MNSIWSRLQQFWATVLELPTNQKTVLGGALIFGLLGIFFILQHLLAGPPYEAVFTQLSPSDASAITAVLQSDKIPYELQDGGATVAVPENQAAEARIQVAGQGLPKGGVVGFEIFDQSQFGMNDFQQHVEYTQALEGELDRTIMQMDEVQEARVEIVLPRESVFVSQTQPATAAVFLKLKPFATLTPAEVRGIMNLVAHSVQGLKAQNVTVVDDRGDVLSSEVGGSSEAVTAGGDLAAQKAFEQHLERNLQAILEPVLGPGNVVAKVSADLNFNQVHTVEHLFTPVQNQAGLVKNLQTLKETFSGTGSTAGIPGTTSNIPGYALGAGGGQNSYSRVETTVNNVYNEATRVTTVAPGAVRRLSVAVVVNRHLSTAETRALTAVVSAAIGADPARHDQITVTGLPFNTSLETAFKKQIAAEEAAKRLQGYLWPAAVLFSLGILGGVTVFALRSRLRRQEQLAQMEALARAKAETVSGGVTAAEGAVPEREVARMAQSQPEGVAEILRAWLREE